MACGNRNLDLIYRWGPLVTKESSMLPSQAHEDPAGEGLWRTSEATWGDLKVTWEGPRGSWLVHGDLRGECDVPETRISLILSLIHI